MSARSRDQVRNHGIGTGIVSTIVDNVVGSSIRLSAKPNYVALGKTKSWADGWARETEALWGSFADTVEFDAGRQLTFLGCTRLLLATEIIQGEGLALPMWIPNRPGSLWATKLQLVDPDRLSNPPNRQDGERLRGGIEVDEFGAPTAYHVRKSHPGDWYFGAMAGLGSPDDWTRVPAWTDWGRRRVIHLHNKERTGQSRGKPTLSPVLAAFRMLDHYERAELQAAVVQGRIAAFMQSNLPPEMMLEMFGGDADKFMTWRSEWRAKLEAGSIIQAFPGDQLSAFMPTRPNQGFGAFCDHVLRRIGVSADLPIELTTKDFSKTNYSSARAALLEAWRSFMSRRQWLATYWADPVYELFLEEAVDKRLIDAPNFQRARWAWCQCRWIGPGRGWIDPEKEAKAATLRMDNMTSTLEQECAEQGLDWEEVLEQRAREKRRQKELEAEYEVSLGPAALPAPTPTNEAEERAAA